MSSGSYWQVYVQCPFYRSDDGRTRIVCEGVGNSKNLSLFFQKKCDFETQMRVFCCDHCKKCEVHRMLMEKYEE